MNHSINSNITFEQLQVFSAVVSQGGVNAAANHLFKSPSTISHALKKLQEQLGIALFTQTGRQLTLTAQGKTLLIYAQQLLDDRNHFLQLAQHLHAEQRTSMTITFDAVFPYQILAHALSQFSNEHSHCQVTLREEVLSGTEERLQAGTTDIAIAYRMIEGYHCEELLSVPFIPVVSSSHPLNNENQINTKMLSNFRQVVISDSGIKTQVDSGWLKSKQRWSVSNFQSAIEVIKSGYAFGWLPRHLIENELQQKQLHTLPLTFEKSKLAHLYMIITDEHCQTIQAMTAFIKQAVAKFKLDQQ